MIRHLITSEYPPQPGGVSDYTKLVAEGLAVAGDEVHVWCPPSGTFVAAPHEDVNTNAGVFVHRELGNFTPADLHRTGKLLDQFSSPRRLLVQWVPHGYGFQSMNLPFCVWLWQRARLKRDFIEVMVHEPFLAFGEGSRKQDVAAAVHRLMVTVLMSAASRFWVSIPEWVDCLRPFVFNGNKPFGWLPVPSTIPVVNDVDGIKGVRAQYCGNDELLVGHFGAYDRYMAELMLELLPSLLDGHDKLSALLIGKGSLELRQRLIERNPTLFTRLHATGVTSAENISRHISACDLMLQPYADGVSGRRTSFMTVLSHGLPAVTTTGKATERCWVESQAVKLTAVGDVPAMVDLTRALLADPQERSRLKAAGTTLYREQFDVQRTIKKLRDFA